MNLFEGKIWKLMRRLAEIFILNTIWLVGCIPLVTAGASTAALLHVFFRMFSKQEEPLLKAFRTGFVSNFKQATAIWVVYLICLFDIGLVIWTGFRMDMLSTWAENKMLLGLCVFIAVLFLFTIHYIFGVIVFFDCTIQQSFVNTLGLCFKHLGTTLLMLFISIITALAVYIAPFLALIAFGLVAAIDSRLLIRILGKYVQPPGPDGTSADIENI